MQCKMIPFGCIISCAVLGSFASVVHWFNSTRLMYIRETPVKRKHVLVLWPIGYATRWAHMPHHDLALHFWNYCKSAYHDDLSYFFFNFDNMYIRTVYTVDRKRLVISWYLFSGLQLNLIMAKSDGQNIFNIYPLYLSNSWVLR